MFTNKRRGEEKRRERNGEKKAEGWKIREKRERKKRKGEEMATYRHFFPA